MVLSHGDLATAFFGDEQGHIIWEAFSKYLSGHESRFFDAETYKDAFSLLSPKSDRETTSIANISLLAKSWLQNCRENHTSCLLSPQDANLPRHIIDISDPQKPILLCGHGRQADYVS